MLSKSVIVLFFLKSMLKKRDQTWLQSILAAHLLQNKNNTPLTRHRTKVNVVEDKVQVFYSEQQQSRKMTDHQHVSITATAPHCEWLMMSHDWWQTGAGPWSKNDNKWHKTAEEKNDRRWWMNVVCSSQQNPDPGSVLVVLGRLTGDDRVRDCVARKTIHEHYLKEKQKHFLSGIGSSAVDL